MPFLAATAVFSLLAGCSLFERAHRPAWRTEAEESCLSQGLVKVTAYVQPSAEINGPGICGLVHPFKIAALADDTVTLNQRIVLACPMIPALNGWISDVVQPAAQARFGQQVVEIETFGSYSCRGIDNMSGASLSEHAFANAIDVSGFVLADGREINVQNDWKKETQEGAFLHDVHQGACDTFSTVLGPGSDMFHYNHIHVDLAHHAIMRDGTMRHVCKPVPQTVLPPPEPDGLPESPPLDNPDLISRRQQPTAPAPAYASVPAYRTQTVPHASAFAPPADIPDPDHTSSIKRKQPAADENPDD
ncbi:extensin-like domain-containing protein [Methylovirgula sp. 4M-Z18]|uniref:extensin-like domain-containing protein n=1 Tax=Methylovirgula sp. 4M-Z18 TaxID=2293567 RepID=UPI0013146285|nr:extensin family protein [Methylovirgula sp. 4M-Z18]